MKDNKLIAEFMGLETSDGCYFEHLTKEGNRELIHHILLKYHTSWDWLMPVVHNIKETDLDFDVLEIGLPIYDVYKAVVEFIKDYNQNK